MLLGGLVIAAIDCGDIASARLKRNCDSAANARSAATYECDSCHNVSAPRTILISTKYCGRAARII